MDQIRDILLALARRAKEARLHWHASRAAVRARGEVPGRTEAFAHHVEADLCLIAALRAAPIPVNFRIRDIILSRDPATAAEQLIEIVYGHDSSRPIEADHEAARLAYRTAFAEPLSDQEQRYADILAALPAARRDKVIDRAEARANLGDRAAKAALLAPADTAAGDAMRQAVTRATARLQPMSHDDAAVDEAAAAAIADAVTRHATGTTLGDDEIAWLLVLLTRPSVWDLAVEHAQPYDQYLAFWTEITRRAPEPLVPAPATMLAVTAWGCDDGVTATLAAERALHADPSHELASLILHTVRTGVTPEEFARTHTTTEPPAGNEPRE